MVIIYSSFSPVQVKLHKRQTEIQGAITKTRSSRVSPRKRFGTSFLRGMSWKPTSFWCKKSWTTIRGGFYVSSFIPGNIWVVLFNWLKPMCCTMFVGKYWTRRGVQASFWRQFAPPSKRGGGWSKPRCWAFLWARAAAGAAFVLSFACLNLIQRVMSACLFLCSDEEDKSSLSSQSEVDGPAEMSDKPAESRIRNLWVHLHCSWSETFRNSLFGKL